MFRIKINNTDDYYVNAGGIIMAKNNLAKLLAGIAVISTGVAVGLTLFKKFDKLSKELEEDEYEDDDFLSDFEEPVSTDVNKEYVTINSIKTSNESELAAEAARDEAVEEFLKESIEEELANELADSVADEMIEDAEALKFV